jgi:riboflavin synthase
MFTGIIEKTARVIGVADGKSFRRITIASDWSDVSLGQSVAVNGVCLTIAEIGVGNLGFDVILETLNKTNLDLINQGDDVHVERSLRIGDRLDGHFVQGHVDGTARLIGRIADDNEYRLRLQAPAHLAKYLVLKGSVTLDGVSLTIAAVDGDRFEVALIPTTLALTTLGRREINWPYNVECDCLAKTVISWLERTGGSAEDIRKRISC